MSKQEASKRQAKKSTGMVIAHRASNSKKEQQSAQMSEQHGCRRGKVLQHHAGRGKSGQKEARTRQEQTRGQQETQGTRATQGYKGTQWARGKLRINGVNGRKGASVIMIHFLQPKGPTRARETRDTMNTSDTRDARDTMGRGSEGSMGSTGAKRGQCEKEHEVAKDQWGQRDGGSVKRNASDTRIQGHNGPDRVNGPGEKGPVYNSTRFCSPRGHEL